MLWDWTEWRDLGTSKRFNPQFWLSRPDCPLPHEAQKYNFNCKIEINHPKLRNTLQ